MCHVIYNVHDVGDIYATNRLSKTALDYLTILKMARTVVICPNDSVSESAEWAEISEQVLDHYGVDEADMNKRLVAVREGFSQIKNDTV